MWDERTRGILKTLAVCLVVGVGVAFAKLLYGKKVGSLAFIADGVHGLFDAAGTIIGGMSVLWSSRPPDQGHPYGHYKFESVSAVVLGALLLVLAYEVGSTAYTRLAHPPGALPQMSFLGVVIVIVTMLVNLSLARFETKMARHYASAYLAADAIHNRSDFLIALAVLATIVSVNLSIPYVDSAVSLLIAVYLVFLAVKLMIHNLKPLVDSSVLDPKEVEAVASAVQGVLHCHQVRSRGERGHHYLDLKLHLPGQITLERAHEIAHEVEARLKQKFPGLVDVIIHTEPHGHPPCRIE